MQVQGVRYIQKSIAKDPVQTNMNKFVSAFPKALSLSQGSLRNFATYASGKQTVSILGAAGGIGQPLSLLLKLNPNISELKLYDVANAPGVTCDLSHVNSPVKITGYQGEEQLEGALKGADLVIVPAGIPRKPGMSRDDLFNVNASIVSALTKAVGQHAPQAWINIISNPVNSTVPIAAKTLQQLGVYDKNKLFGVSTLDVVRAKTFYSETKNLKVSEVDLQVVGGHAGKTILPIFSQAHPKASLSQQETETLTERVQNGGTEVVNAKAGTGSATLSMAYAAALFGDSCLRAQLGEKGVEECSYVESNVFKEVPFFSVPVQLGQKGIEGYNQGKTAVKFDKISEYEKSILDTLKPELSQSIERGLSFKPLI